MLETVDLSLKLDREDYEKQLADVQLRLVRVQPKVRAKGVKALVMYEGWDAAGKGGSILRITEKMDPRGYHVWPISAPTPDELAHHYLWRFWTKLPGNGQVAIFDRSWYGRVLVERVEKFAKRKDWEQAYGEIRDFERTLTDDGLVLIKFWLHISKDEQLKRFKDRENDPYKSWKITKDDWRNREKWDEYAEAAEDMFRETNADNAPWHIVSAENKRHARVATARIVADALEKATGE